MKHSIKIASVIFMLLAYGLAMGLSVPQSTAAAKVLTEGESTHYQAAHLPDLLHHLPQGKSSVSVQLSVPVSSAKDRLQQFWLFEKVRERSVNNRLKQHVRASGKFLSRHRKADLIFPFHYFW